MIVAGAMMMRKRLIGLGRRTTFVRLMSFHDKRLVQCRLVADACRRGLHTQQQGGDHQHPKQGAGQTKHARAHRTLPDGWLDARLFGRDQGRDPDSDIADVIWLPPVPARTSPLGQRGFPGSPVA